MASTLNNTTRESLKTLAKSLINKLENKKFIEINSKNRTALQEELSARLSKNVLTDEDITHQVRAQVGQVSGALTDQNITETDAFQSQKRALKAKLGDNLVQGFYLQSTLRSVCMDVCKFLFDTKNVEEVFESDEAIQKLVMETFQTFDETKIS